MIMTDSNKSKHRSTIDFEELKTVLKEHIRLVEEKDSCLTCWPKKTIDRFHIIRLRAMMSLSVCATIALVSCIIQNYFLTIALLGNIVIWVDTIYLCIYNEGRDFYWLVHSSIPLCLKSIKNIFANLAFNSA